MLDTIIVGITEKAIKADKQKLIEKPPICEECDEEMHRYEEAADTGHQSSSSIRMRNFLPVFDTTWIAAPPA